MEPFDNGPRGVETPRPGTPDSEMSQGYRGASPLFRGRDLVMARWMMVTAQIAGVFVVAQFMGLPLPLAPLALVIGAGVLMNIIVIIWSGRRPSVSRFERTVYLTFDALQLAALLYLTGGSTNPFCLALIWPARMAATMLPTRHAIALAAMIAGICFLLAFYAEPTPWPSGIFVRLPLTYRLACSLADALGVAFGFGFGWWTARQAARMEFALHLTDTFLARQQRLSALGGLAAAAAHELGTPLTTIAVVAKEMARDAPQGPLREDAWLLVEQASRCRDILKRLAQTPETSDALHERIDLGSLVEEISAPYATRRQPTVKTVVAGPPSQATPDLWRRPEVLPAMTSIVENAVDFATGEVRITARYDARSITIEVRDDGPGFDPEIFARLGEPYVTSRPDTEPLGGGHVGMGLGLFIAKTLLERTGARVTFANGRPHGAVVAARWPRAQIEASAVTANQQHAAAGITPP